VRWSHWISLYTQTHCTARGLCPATIAVYAQALEQFRAWVRFRAADVGPEAIRTREVLAYVEHLRRERGNGDSAVNRHVVVLRSFYRAMVAMGELEPARNPMAHFPRVKAPRRKLPHVLSEPEVTRLLATPEPDSVLGLRDRALLQLLYATGIRASEAASLRERDVDLAEATVRVCGKGGHERTLPLNAAVVASLETYRRARGPATPEAPFFVTRRRRAMTRGGVYERVRTGGRRARLPRRVTPHCLRHTFATHLVRAGVGLVTIRDLLGHRQITSTQLYLHVTAQDLREAADRHPIARLVALVAPLLPEVRLPFQRVPPPPRRARPA
jgi:site-specific recombinase XerD